MRQPVGEHTLTDLKAIVEGFSGRRVLLLGDTILDIYTYGTAMGLSAETPTIVARRKEVKYSLGGAALVCRNLLELGAAVEFVTLVGADEEAAHVRGFQAPKLRMRAVVDAERPTTVKHRFWVDGYKLFQLDQREDRAVSREMGKRVVAEAEAALAETDIVVISDYRHGLLSAEVVAELMPKLHASGKRVYVDSQVSQNASNHRHYRGGCVICLNLREAQAIDGGFKPERNAAAFAELNRALDTDRIVIKLGAEGALFQDGARVAHAPANKVAVADVTGAGDAFLAAFCLAGADEPEGALRLANAWAGLSVQIHGTVPPKREDLLRAAKEN